jgi:hypothetical protein
VRARPTFAFEVLEDIAVLASYQSPRNPTDEEWEVYLEVLARLHQSPREYRYFTVSDGGHPSGEQQARVKAVVPGKNPAVALVSASVAMRFVGAALALFNSRVRCFRPNQMVTACAHIGLGSRDVPRIEAVIAGLKSQVLAA